MYLYPQCRFLDLINSFSLKGSPLGQFWPQFVPFRVQSMPASALCRKCVQKGSNHTAKTDVVFTNRVLEKQWKFIQNNEYNNTYSKTNVVLHIKVFFCLLYIICRFI